MGRALGIDLGKKRIGLALSDPLKKIAFPLKTIQTLTSLEKTVHLILKELNTVDMIVLGLPLLLSGQDSHWTHTVRQYATLLKTHTQLPLVLWDERLTTIQVEKILKKDMMCRKKRVKNLDMMSATLILQTYLDQMHYTNG